MGRAGRLTGFTPKRRERFLAALADGYSVSKASDEAGLSRQSFYAARERDEDFAEEWDEAIEAGTDKLEDEARRRAHDGVDEPAFYQGGICGHVRKYSDTLLIFLLKARRPDKYRERHSHEHTGKDGGPIEVSDARESLARRIAGVASRTGPDEADPGPDEAGS